MENEKIIAKIKKLFELSKNNPSAEEAQSAVLKAQELLQQYHIEYAEVENISLDKVEEIEEVSIDIPPKKWKYTLADIIAKNFRCKHFYYGKERLVFYGHKTDATIAMETFRYLFNFGNRLGNRLAREERARRGWADNVYNSCVIGFCVGIKQALAEQSTALMVVVPEDVTTKFEDRSKHMRNSVTHAPKAYTGKAFDTGREQGYNAIKRNRIGA